MTNPTKDIAQAVAVKLGPTWAYIPDETTYISLLRRKDGLEIWITSNDGPQLRVEQNTQAKAWRTADGDRVTPTRYERPSINVSVKKSATALALEIIKRLIPDCEHWHERALREVRIQNKDFAARKAAAQELRIKPKKHNHYTEYTRAWSFGTDWRNVTATVNSPSPDQDAVPVDLQITNVTAAQARAVIELLGLKI